MTLENDVLLVCNKLGGFRGKLVINLKSIEYKLIIDLPTPEHVELFL
jgi:hypothetical protein